MSLNDGEAERLLAMMQVYSDGTKALRGVFEQRERQRRLKMYKNAGIKSMKEAAQRLINGEVFYIRECKLYFDVSKIPPFRVGSDSILNLWRDFEEWQIKSEWYEDLGEGVLCWAWDSGDEERSRTEIVVRYEAERVYKFGTERGCWFAYAEPITKEEAKKFIWGANDE